MRGNWGDGVVRRHGAVSPSGRRGLLAVRRLEREARTGRFALTSGCSTTGGRFSLRALAYRQAADRRKVHRRSVRHLGIYVGDTMVTKSVYGLLAPWRTEPGVLHPHTQQDVVPHVTVCVTKAFPSSL